MKVHGKTPSLPFRSRKWSNSIIWGQKIASFCQPIWGEYKKLVLLSRQASKLPRGVHEAGPLPSVAPCRGHGCENDVARELGWAAVHGGLQFSSFEHPRSFYAKARIRTFDARNWEFQHEQKIKIQHESTHRPGGCRDVEAQIGFCRPGGRRDWHFRGVGRPAAALGAGDRTFKA